MGGKRKGAAAPPTQLLAELAAVAVDFEKRMMPPGVLLS